MLAEAPKGSVLVDARQKGVAREDGSPDLRSIKRSVVALPFDGDDAEGYGEAAVKRLKKAIREGATVAFVDESGASSMDAARAFAAARAEAASEAGEDAPEPGPILSVTGGCDLWQMTEDLPWKEPVKVDFALPGIDTAFLEENEKAVKGAAITALGLGASVFLLTEIETLLELAGFIGLGQIAVSNFLYAEDREKFEAKTKELWERAALDEVAADLSGAFSGAVAATDVEAPVEAVVEVDAEAEAEVAEEAGEAVDASTEVEAEEDEATEEPVAEVEETVAAEAADTPVEASTEAEPEGEGEAAADEAAKSTDAPAEDEAAESEGKPEEIVVAGEGKSLAGEQTVA
eukprot:PRCOL_00000570-RA